jgi:anti-sigma factor ChrR (cupin superfamily)
MIPPDGQREEFEARAALHALGALSPHESRVLEARLDEAPAEWAAEARDFESVVAYLALAAPEARPAPGLRARVLSRAAESRRSGKRRRAHSAPPAINVRLGEIEWEPMAEGVLYKPLFYDREKQLVTTLVRMLPGASVPRHRHLGIEQCLVLEGDFRVGGEVYGPGDFQCVFEGSVHEDIRTETGALVMIIAPPEYLVVVQ